MFPPGDISLAGEAGRRLGNRRPAASLLVANALVLVVAPVEDPTGGGVPLEPRTAALELAASLDRTDAVPISSVLCHTLHLRPEGPGPLCGALSR